MDFFSAVLRNTEGIIKTIQINDIVDIIIVSFLAYSVVQLVRETRAEQLVKGILVLSLSYFLATQFGLYTVSLLMQNLFSFGVLALLVVFQPELRRALEQVGRTKFRLFGLFDLSQTTQEDKEQLEKVIAVTCEAVEYLSQNRIGALIIFQKETKLGDIIKTGTVIDSIPSIELLCNIFFPNSPLHDGAVVIKDQRLYAAGCFLPLSSNVSINKNLGTRHRAALGMSENSDAVIIVVSEETGIISMAKSGMLRRRMDKISLASVLTEELIIAPVKFQNSEHKSLFWRVRQK